MKSNILKILILSFVLFALSGCGKGADDYAETTITVEKKGKVSETIVERFDKDYYNIDELKEEFVNSVKNYNESIGSEEIKLGDIELKDSQVFVDIDFTGPSDYESFTGESLFVGTIHDAYDNGYTMDVILKGVDKGDRIEKAQIMGMSDRTIVILSEHARIKTFADIDYVSANVDVIKDRQARVSNESYGLAYLILK